MLTTLRHISRYHLLLLLSLMSISGVIGASLYPQRALAVIACVSVAPAEIPISGGLYSGSFTATVTGVGPYAVTGGTVTNQDASHVTFIYNREIHGIETNFENFITIRDTSDASLCTVLVRSGVSAAGAVTQPPSPLINNIGGIVLSARTQGIGSEIFSVTSFPSTAPITEALCTTDVAPVCGVDGATYSNRCVAEQQRHVVVARDGVCDAIAPSRDFAALAGATRCGKAARTTLRAQSFASQSLHSFVPIFTDEVSRAIDGATVVQICAFKRPLLGDESIVSRNADVARVSEIIDNPQSPFFVWGLAVDEMRDIVKGFIGIIDAKAQVGRFVWGEEGEGGIGHRLISTFRDDEIQPLP